MIDPSLSRLSSPVVWVKKKDGSTRLYVDCRQLNSSTRKDTYSLLRSDPTLDSLTGSNEFFVLKSGYSQVEIEPEDREKTVFTVRSGLWQCRVFPIGLYNAPATFKRLMQTILKGLSWETCLLCVYIISTLVVKINSVGTEF